MSLAPALRIVLYEGNGAQTLGAEDRFATLTSLLTRGYGVTSASGERAVAPADKTPAVVLGRFGGAAPEVDGASTRDITDLNPVQIADLVETVRAETNAPKHGEWKPWFPVIDYDRCTNCMQC